MATQNLGIVSPVPKGEWSSSEVYNALNVVRIGGSSYIAKLQNTNIQPGVTNGWETYWMLLNNDGAQGGTGPQGAPGEGVPTGGLEAQLLAKSSNSNYATEWIPQNQINAGSAITDAAGNNIPNTYETKQHAQQTYETKTDATTKNANLQNQITQNQTDISTNAENITVNSQGIETNKQLISRNSKRLDGLEQRITPSPFVTDDTIAYMKDVPANAVGSVEIMKLGGMTYRDSTTYALSDAAVTNVKSIGANVIPYPFKETTLTRSGVTFTDNGNGSITLSGTASATDSFTLWSNTESPLPVGYYSSIANGLCELRCSHADNSSSTFPITGGTLNITKPIIRILLIVRSGQEYNGTIYPMLNRGEAVLPYVPYMEKSLSISSMMQSVSGYGWGISSSCYNYIDWDKKQFVKNVGSVDLGTLTWTASSSNRFFATPLNLYSASSLTDLPVALLSADYVPSSGQQFNAYDKSFYISLDGMLAIKDTAYADAVAFKAAMSGVLFYYELATPEITDISNLITLDNLIDIQGYGTIFFENNNKFAVPSTVEYITAESAS